VRLTVTTGFAATVLSFLLAMGFCAWAWQRPLARRIGAWLARCWRRRIRRWRSGSRS